MDSIEEQALRKLKVEFVRRLDVEDYVLDFLEQEGALSDLKCEHIRDIWKRSRSEAAQATIDAVLKKSVVPVFINGLLCGNSHPFLAKLLTDKIHQLKQEELVRESQAASNTDLDLDSRSPLSSVKNAFHQSLYHQSHSLHKSHSFCQEKSSQGFSNPKAFPQNVSSFQNQSQSHSYLQRQNVSQSHSFPQSQYSKNQLCPQYHSFSSGSSFTSCSTDSSMLCDPDETCELKLETRVHTDGGGESPRRGTQRQFEEEHGRQEEASKCEKYRNNEAFELPDNSPAPGEEEVEEEEEEEEDDDSQNALVIPKQPNQVDVMDKKKRTLTKIHYHLKLLSHDGQKEKFTVSVCKYKKRYHDDPDILFTLLDAEVESRRLVYDEGLHKGDIFNDMESCITTSSQPLANIVMFLARKGSARTMKESLEVGLDMLEEARALSEQIKPCKDTGMVLYILINILFQMYEKSPCLRLKQRIIRTIDEAINDHFAASPPFLREDYTRMLYLKMVFCYLGIGLFGDPIRGCEVSKTDVNAAKSCLHIIDNSKAKFDSRREMFYFMAKSVLCKKQGEHKDALDHAETAKRKAQVCGFKKELGPIQELTGVLERTVAEQNERESEEREEEIDTELDQLKSQRELVKSILRKPSNQWGDPHRK